MKRPLFWISCGVCKVNFINPDGTLGNKRREDTPPQCARCVKVTHEDCFADERAMKAVFFHRLGIPDTDDIIKGDSWMYTAIKVISAHEHKVEQASIDREMNSVKNRVSSMGMRG